MLSFWWFTAPEVLRRHISSSDKENTPDHLTRDFVELPIFSKELDRENWKIKINPNDFWKLPKKVQEAVVNNALGVVSVIFKKVPSKQDYDKNERYFRLPDGTEIQA
jgi:hypothetical protein